MNDSRIIYEFQQVGAYVKVTAMDPVTLTEVSIVGNPQAGKQMLTRTAKKKLQYVIEKNKNSKKEDDNYV